MQEHTGHVTMWCNPCAIPFFVSMDLTSTRLSERRISVNLIILHFLKLQKIVAFSSQVHGICRKY